MRVTDLSQLSLICPSNDGESKMIIDIANRRGIDTRVSPQPWGATLNKEPNASFLNLKKIVAIVEIPGIEKEEELKRNGHEVIIIDHHKYGDIDRGQKMSSLEQFSQLTGIELDRFEKGVAINDRSYIFGLKEMGYSSSEILEFREYDLKAQGLTQEVKEFLVQKFSAGFEIVPGIMMFDIPSHVNESYLRDLIALKIGIHISTLVFKSRKDGSISQIVFTGSPPRAKKLKESFGGGMGGDERYSLIWWINDRDIRDEVKNILGI